ncbi:hypothetical protein, partial [Streptococcus suis]|uniref:hypothetical protein n=1 Tax=Streptococcus suis TaxID=1307 RepID=UPI002AAB34CE
RHGLDAEKYMTYLLEHLPNEESLAKKEVLEAYLPWDKSNRPITRYLSTHSLLQYTVRKTKLEDLLCHTPSFH